MNAFLRVLVVGNALLLALPPGWCCTTPVVKTPSSPRPAPSCCHQEGPPASDSQPAPCQTPATRCCCQFDSTPPPDHAKYTVDSALSLPLVLAAVPNVSHPALAAEASAMVFPSPPLNILQCVWRC